MIAIEPKSNKLLRGAAEAAFSLLGLKGEAVVELSVVGERRIHALNKAHRGMDKPTDVLSFPMLAEIKPFNAKNYPFERDEDGRVLLGSIVICKEVAAAQAAEYGHSNQREMCFLFVHGLLHLLGFDHEDEGQRAEMRNAEERILGEIGMGR